MVDTGRYTVTNAEAYERAVGATGDVPDEVHIHDVDGDVRVQELWPDRGEGRFTTIAQEDARLLEDAVDAN